MKKIRFRISLLVSFNFEKTTYFDKIRKLRNAIKRTVFTNVNKNVNFYLNNAADCHINFNKFLFINFKINSISKIIKIVNNELFFVRDIEFIIFELNIENKKIINIVINVKYVFDLNYNLFFIDIFEKNKCEIIQK